MKILVTGGAGFMGSHFVELMISLNHEVFVIDKLTYAGSLDNLSEFGFDLVNNFSYSDIGCSGAVERILIDFKPDVIVNFAAETHVDRSIRSPMSFLETDIMGLFSLVLLARKYKVERFIHISTDEVYGSIENKALLRSEEFTNLRVELGFSFKSEASENFPLNPTSPYSASKAAADLLLLSYFKTYNFPVMIVRPCNNYGPRQYPEKLIPMAITRLLKGEKILLHGKGEEIREWIYVKDCCVAINAVLMHGKVGEIYNIGSGKRGDNKEVIHRIIDYWKEPNVSKTGYDCHIEYTPNRPGNDQRYAMNSSKLVKTIGGEGDYFCVEEFDDALKKTVEWYRQNQGKWPDIDLEANVYKEGQYLR